MTRRTLFERMSDIGRKPPAEHEFAGELGACKGCGKYVEELIDERYCSGSRRSARQFDEGGEG